MGINYMIIHELQNNVKPLIIFYMEPLTLASANAYTYSESHIRDFGEAPMPIDPKTRTRWTHHMQEEVNAAYLYRELAQLEENPKRREVFEKLAGVEDRHTNMWREIFREHELPLPDLQPAGKARLQAWAARREIYAFLARYLAPPMRDITLGISAAGRAAP